MKVAVFSDVQGNLPAMETVVDDIVRWSPDLVVMNGDLVNRGPSSADCLLLFDQFRRSHAWLPVQGNHEEFVLFCLANRPDSIAETQLRKFADWTAEQVGDLAYILRDWPDHLTFAAPRSERWVHLTHGTLAGNRDGVTPERTNESLIGKVPEDIALFVTAHTHRALQRQCGNLQIVNTGSVGSPFDGDTRASYGQLEFRRDRWYTRIVRLEYDRTQTARDFRDSGFLTDGGPLAPLIFEEWRLARMMINDWNNTYRPAVLAGMIEADQAVNEFLRQHAKA